MSKMERLRNSAATLLRQLRHARAESAARRAETGAEDPMTQIRGRSAMDQAVAETEILLARIDTMMARPGDPPAASEQAGAAPAGRNRELQR